MSEWSINNGKSDIRIPSDYKFTNPLNGIETNSTLPLANVQGEANVDSANFSNTTTKFKSVGDIVAEKLTAYIKYPNPATAQRMSAFSEILDNGYSPKFAYALNETAREYFSTT